MKVCIVCQVTEIPNTPRHTTCSLACRRIHRRRLWLTTRPVQTAIEARRLQARRITEQRIRAVFGPTLSARDIAIFQAGMKLGYSRGYSVAWRRARTEAA